MSIDITAEVKFSRIADGEYEVRLRDANETVIGKIYREDGGWKSYGLRRVYQGFGETRYQASRGLLEQYELYNGLRDAEGRRVGRDPETKGYWCVLSPIGTRQSERWTDKAEAAAHLASLNALTVYKLVTNHTDGPRVRHFASFEEALEAGQATDPEKDGSMLPNLSEAVMAEFGGTDEEYEKGLFWLRSNRYAAIYRKELTGATAEAYRRVFEFEEIGRQAALADEPAAPAANAKVQAALAGRTVGDPFNARIMEAFSRGYQVVRDQQATEVIDPTAELAERLFNTVHPAQTLSDRVDDETNEEDGLDAWTAPETAIEAEANVEIDQRRCIEAGEHLRSSRHIEAECTGIVHRPGVTVVYETVIQDEASREITPVMVWPHGRVETGIEKLRKILEEIAYGHGDDSHMPKLYITRDADLIEAVTRRVDYRKSGDDWIDEQWGVYAATDTQHADPLYLLGLRIDGRA